MEVQTPPVARSSIRLVRLSTLSPRHETSASQTLVPGTVACATRNAAGLLGPTPTSTSTTSSSHTLMPFTPGAPYGLDGGYGAQRIHDSLLLYPVSVFRAMALLYYFIILLGHAAFNKNHLRALLGTSRLAWSYPRTTMSSSNDAQPGSPEQFPATGAHHCASVNNR